MKVLSFLIPFVFPIFLGTATAATLHGVRNEKCAADELAARTQIVNRLRTDAKLCDAGTSANQWGGWSCHAGRDCPKGKFRCNTQYECGPMSPPSPVALAPSPLPSSETVTKREFVKDGVTYIEETTTDGKGMSSKMSYPKSGQETTETTTTTLPNGDLKTTSKTTGPGVTVSGSFTERPDQNAARKKNQEVMAKAIASCTPSKGTSEDPAAPGSKAEWEISAAPEGKCRLTEIVAAFAGMKIVCNFTPAQREEMGKNGGAALEKAMTATGTCDSEGPPQPSQ